MASQPSSGWAGEEIRRACVNSAFESLGDACIPVRKSLVGEAFPHMARDGGLSLIVLQDVEPSPGGQYQLSGSGRWLPLRTLGKTARSHSTVG